MRGIDKWDKGNAAWSTCTVNVQQKEIEIYKVIIRMQEHILIQCAAESMLMLFAYMIYILWGLIDESAVSCVCLILPF